MTSPRPAPAPRAPQLPHTWRPFGARIAGCVFGGALIAVCVAFWVLIGAENRARFTPFQIGTIVFVGLLAAAAWLALMRSKVTADDQGLVVVNGYRRRRLEWAQVVGVGLRRGAPWAHVDVSDGTTISMCGIQGSDGPRAVAAVRELRVLVKEHSARPGRP